MGAFVSYVGSYVGGYDGYNVGYIVGVTLGSTVGHTDGSVVMFKDQKRFCMYERHTECWKYSWVI